MLYYGRVLKWAISLKFSGRDSVDQVGINRYALSRKIVEILLETWELLLYLGFVSASSQPPYFAKGYEDMNSHV